MPWSRRLDPKGGKPNPRLLDGKDSSYQIFIEHVLPKPVPKGSTQVWQIVDCQTLIIDKNCKLKFEKTTYVDIVNIGGRTAIPDDLHVIDNQNHCFYWEYCTHTIGFSPKGTAYNTVGSETNFSAAALKTLRTTMRGPKATFKTNYVFNRGDCCKELKDFLFFGFPVPAGEWYQQEGLGGWSFPPRKEEKKKSDESKTDKAVKNGTKKKKLKKKSDKAAGSKSGKGRK